MEYNLKGVRDQVILDKLDDESFDPGTVDRFINTVQRRIFNTFELPFMEAVFSGVLPAEQRIFVFPAEVQSVKGVVITSPTGEQTNITDKQLRYKDFLTKYPTPANNTPGAISEWMSFAGKIYTSAPTDVAYQMDTFYTKKPTLLVADEDVPEIPEEFQELLVLGAYQLVLERNEDYDLAAVIQGQFDRQIDLLVDRYGLRMSDGGITMAQPRARTTRRNR